MELLQTLTLNVGSFVRVLSDPEGDPLLLLSWSQQVSHPLVIDLEEAVGTEGKTYITTHFSCSYHVRSSSSFSTRCQKQPAFKLTSVALYRHRKVVNEMCTDKKIQFGFCIVLPAALQRNCLRMFVEQHGYTGPDSSTVPDLQSARVLAFQTNVFGPKETLFKRETR